MSFAHELKTELCDVTRQKKCCKKAEFYGLLLFAAVFSAKEIKLSTENAAVAKRFARLAFDVCGVDFELSKKASGYVCGAQDEAAAKVFSFMGHSSKSLSLYINFSNLEKDCCSAAFLRGVFLAGGSITDPANDYFLEIATPHKALAQDLIELLSLHELSPKLAIRKSVQIIYFKSSTEIEDLLTIIGAAKHAFEIMNVKIYKDIKNRQNRLLNFEMANLTKTVSAAMDQVKAIERIEAAGLLNSLPKELFETAQARLQNPELPLSQIRQLLCPVPSRSGLNHRLQKLIEIAKEL